MAKFIGMIQSDEFFNGKTVFSIINKKSGHIIGQVFWYKPWRRWCARFDEDTVWSEDCLTDVRMFIEQAGHEGK